MTNYVLSFIFDRKMTKVLLIKKERPSWQSGLYNGIGGHIEENETPLEAIKREILEESGLVIDDILPVGDLEGGNFNVKVFVGQHSNLDSADSLTDEKVEVVSVANPPSNVIGNLNFLIPACRDFILNPYSFKEFKISYK